MSKRRRRARDKQLRHSLAESVRPRTVAAGSGLAVAASLVSGSVAMAASTIEVDTTVDDGSLNACTTADDDCSLRGAIGVANADPNSTITFASSVTGGTISLASDLPTISAGQTIEGLGADTLTINDNGGDGLTVDTAPGPVAISGLTFTNSKYEGISSSGTGLLTLSGVTVSGSGEAGVSAQSPLAIDRSTITGSAKYAGICGCAAPGDSFGVYATAGLTMENSTVTYSGSIFTKYGGGVKVTHGGTFENSTIAGNGPTSGVGINADGAYAVVLDSTIVADNVGSSAGGDVNVTNSGTVTENFSLIQNTTGLPPLESGSGDNLNGQDPLLQPLADNGGPTQTKNLSAQSPAVDTGKDFTGTGKDQRGVAIVDAPGIDNAADGRDMGAVEVEPPSVSDVAPDHADAGETISIFGENLSGTTDVKFGGMDGTNVNVVNDGQVNVDVPAGSGTVDITVTTPVGTSDVTADDKFTYGSYVVDTKSDDASLSDCTTVDDDCSLRGAITASNDFSNRKITFAPDLNGYISRSTDLPTVSGGQTITGPGADVLELDANGAATGLIVDTGVGPVTVSGLGMTHTTTGLSSTGPNPLTLSKVSVTGSAGAAVNAKSDLQIDESTASGNQSGVTSYYALTVQNSTVSGNTGTGLDLRKGGTVENSTITGNGSGIVVPTGYSLNLQSTIVSGNDTADVDAGTSGVTENYSLVQDPSGLPAALQPGSGNNLNGQDPQLGSLKDNGGPTQTLLPAASSPVIDQGQDATGSGHDQRGIAINDEPSVANAADGRDIGAAELAPPTVSGVSPGTGNSGDTVTITGTHLTGTTGVKFGSADATGVHVLDDTHVTAVVPAGGGTVDVTVTSPDGTSPTSSNDKFRYLAPPTVSSLSPSRGNAGDTVTITGTNFTGASGVKFGDTNAVSFSVVDATHVTAVAPAGSGTVDVTVVNGDGTSATSAADRFHYLAPPTVSSLSPKHGRKGTTVTITGTNLTGATGVKFGSADATGVQVVDDTHVTAIAPAGKGKVAVTVTTPEGTSTVGVGDKFKYDPRHLTDRQVLKLMRRSLLVPHFVTKPKTLVFKDRLPESGSARYHLILLKNRDRKGADERSVLGDLATVSKKGAHKVEVTIHLSARDWRILRRNPTGQLVVHTGFKRKYNGHVIRTSRPIEPTNRPGT